MAIAIDASTPAVVSSSATSTLTTASFSPPAGALLVACAAAIYSSGSNATITVSDSGSHSWSTGINVAGHGTVQITRCQLTTAPGSITVSAAWANLTGDSYLGVTVLTGAATSQTGAGTGSLNTGSGSTNGVVSVTTTQVGSWVFGMADDWSFTAALTPNSATTLITPAFTDSTNGCYAVSWRSTSATTTPGATNYGGTYGSSATTVNAALEILPALAGPNARPFFITTQAVQRAASL